MKLQVKLKVVYGRVLAYPDCEKSKIFCELLGRTTLNAEQVRLITKLGFDILAQSPTAPEVPTLETMVGEDDTGNQSDDPLAWLDD